jgi:hypothetical protein
MDISPHPIVAPPLAFVPAPALPIILLPWCPSQARPCARPWRLPLLGVQPQLARAPCADLISPMARLPLLLYSSPPHGTATPLQLLFPSMAPRRAAPLPQIRRSSRPLCRNLAEPRPFLAGRCFLKPLAPNIVGCYTPWYWSLLVPSHRTSTAMSRPGAPLPWSRPHVLVVAGSSSVHRARHKSWEQLDLYH